MKKYLFIFYLFLFSALSVFALSNIARIEWDYQDTSNISKFRVYFSELSQSYSTNDFVEVPKSLRTASIRELRFSTKYFFVATAIDIYGRESARSEEISYIMPTLAPSNLRITTVYTSAAGDAVTIRAIIVGTITNSSK